MALPTRLRGPGSLLQFELQAAGAPAPDAEVMISVFTVEGLLMHDHDEAQQRAIIDALASRWTTNLPRPSDLGR